MRRLNKMIKLMTYNIHNGVGRDNRYDLHRIEKVIRSEKPDIVALQEVDNRLSRSNFDNQSEYLAERLGLDYLHCVTRTAERGEFGITILSAYPCIHNHRYDISHPSGKEPRYCLRVDVQVEEGAVLHVFNCHLGLAARERRYQQRQMLSEAILLSRDIEDPVLLMGDFNDRPVKVVHNHLMLYFKDAYKSTGKRFGPTFRLGPIPLRLDYIYTSPEIHIIDSWVRNDPLTRVASDHRPLLALIDVEWRPQEIKRFTTSSLSREGQ